MQQFAPDAPRFTVGLGQDGRVAVVHLAHYDHPRPRRVLRAPLFHQVNCDLGVGDDERGFAANHKSVDSTVDARPFLELEPWLGRRYLLRVAYEGQGCWTRR